MNEKKFFGFFRLMLELKKNKRSGWVDRKVQDPESIADHSFQLALMALVLGKDAGINVNKAVKMALVHDLPEAITGDISVDHIYSYGNSVSITPHISKHQKQEKEIDAMQKIAEKLEKKTAKEIVGLWREFDERKTKTARFVKDLDYLEVLLQALEYKKTEKTNALLNDFFKFHTTFKTVKNPKLKRYAKKILAEKIWFGKGD